MIISKVAKYINEKKREAENKIKTNKLQQLLIGKSIVNILFYNIHE